MTPILKDLLNTIQFGDLSNEELNQVQAAIQYRRGVLTRDIKRQIRVGDSVQFYHSQRNQTLQGAVAKVAIKYVTVQTMQGRWKVPANMLEIV